MSVDINDLRQKQAQGLTVGVVPRSGTPALRLEIDDLLQDSELANLYFLALEAFMSSRNAPNPFSYYEISGIHGQPQRAWDNVTSVNFGNPKPSPFGGRAPGYCSHGSVLFPTWHRAYLAQFEQAMFLHAADIAPRLNAQAVLERFRVPYWDPFLPRQRSLGGLRFTYGIPIVFTLPRIQVRRPENPNVWVPMDNPLYQFSFPADSRQPGINWNTFSQFANVNAVASRNTIRGYDGSTPRANHSFVIRTFDESFNPITLTPRNTDTAGRLWRVMFDNKSYASVSNHTVLGNRLGPPGRNDYNQNSIEGFHDDIHGFLGKGPNSERAQNNPYGHMAWPSFAGFDPAFWLHHCNVDRIFAIWQGIHSNDLESNQWWTSLDNRDGTFVEPVGVPETPNTPLAPFRKARTGPNVTWWTSNDVRDTRRLGYDYPQVAQARRSGSLVNGLRAWANASLGWADPNNIIPQPGDLGALTTFIQVQIPSSISSFQRPVLIDGAVAIPNGTDYISSLSRSPRPLASAAAAVTADSEKIDGTAHDANTQRVLAQALPDQDPSFEDRFGNLGDLVSESRKMTQWNATFRVEKYALDGPFMIHFFLGDFDNADDAVWLHEANRVGTSSIFANPQAVMDEGGCASCEQKSADGFRYYDTVGLTQALLTYVRSGDVVNDLRLEDLEPQGVLPFLIRNFHWRVVNSQGSTVSRATIPSLKVAVYSETVTLPAHLTDVPRFDDKVLHYTVTNGRPGGLNDGEEL